MHQNKAVQNRYSWVVENRPVVLIPATKPVLFFFSDKVETDILYRPNPNEAIHILLNSNRKDFDTTIFQKTKKNFPLLAFFPNNALCYLSIAL